MKIKLSKQQHGCLAVAGHVGSGHCHSHNNYTQDDSGGLATVLTLFQEATGLSLVIKDIKVKTGMDGFVEVETQGGGYGKATARRGFTLQEARLAKTVIGREAIRTQAIVLEAFGRFYGQGIHEAPVALQTAIANAALDTFVKNYPDQFKSGYEDLAGACGLIAGAVLDFDDIAVSVLGTVNASVGGIGPIEDYEGNAAIGTKKKIMAELGMLDLPTIVIEGKVYSPVFSKDVNEPTFLVRQDPQADNSFVAASIVRAGEALGLPLLHREDVMVRTPGAMANQTKVLGEKIAVLGLKLQQAEYAQEKVDILAELAILVSQDGAGISFMTNRLHEVIGGTGMIHGTGAVFNYLVPVSYRQEFVFPFLTEQDMTRYAALTKQAVIELYKVLPEAAQHAKSHKYSGDLDALVLKGG